MGMVNWAYSYLKLKHVNSTVSISGQQGNSVSNGRLLGYVVILIFIYDNFGVLSHPNITIPTLRCGLNTIQTWKSQDPCSHYSSQWGHPCRLPSSNRWRVAVFHWNMEFSIRKSTDFPFQRLMTVGTLETFIYPPVIKHGNGRYTMYRWLAYWLKPPFVADFPLLCLITRGYWIFDCMQPQRISKPWLVVADG